MSCVLTAHIHTHTHTHTHRGKPWMGAPTVGEEKPGDQRAEME
jgi:hypothetical protein